MEGVRGGGGWQSKGGGMLLFNGGHYQARRGRGRWIKEGDWWWGWPLRGLLWWGGGRSTGVRRKKGHDLVGWLGRWAGWLTGPAWELNSKIDKRVWKLIWWQNKLEKILKNFLENCWKARMWTWVNFGAQNLQREISRHQGIQEKCQHAMHPKQDYFRKVFYMQGWIDMQPTCNSKLAKFYSFKKRVL
jgi:hypothetical protein